MSIIFVWILVFMICLYWSRFRLTCGEKNGKLWKFIIDTFEKSWCGIQVNCSFKYIRSFLGIWLLNFSGEKLIQFEWGTIHAIHSPDSRTICQRFHHYRRPSPQWSTGSWLEKQIPTVSFSMTWVNFPVGPQYP